ncbi:MAG: tetratricopeptide repeat protein [Sphingobacteriaceae bacterium]|nr:tetratricopeptide repeat protein [Sphingobacteriaceae bacterium]
MRQKLFWLIFLTFYGLYFFSQEKTKSDLIQNIYTSSVHDTLKIIQLGQLISNDLIDDPSGNLQILNSILKIADGKIGIVKGAEKKFYVMTVFTVYNNIGLIKKKIGDINEATNYYFKALEMAETANYLHGISYTANNIGALYKTVNNHEKSLKYYKIGLEASIKSNDERGMANAYKSLAGYYKNIQDTGMAHEYLNKAIEIYKKLESNSALTTCYNNLGDLYLRNRLPEVALKHLQLAEENCKPQKDQENLSIIYNNYGRAYLQLNNYNKAIEYANKSLGFQKENKFPEIFLSSHQILYNAYEAGKNYKNAIYHYKIYRQFDDSINNLKNQGLLITSDLRHDFEKKEMLMKSEQDKKEAIAEAENKKQKIISLLIGAALILSLVFFIIVYKNYKEKKQLSAELANTNQVIINQKHLVEEKQKEIVDSINYAQKIQKTLLANHEFVNQTIPDSFVLFQPKDIVSGDFYWATKNESRFYLAVCDSTGHGVPGAFMSLLNISFLNEAINEKNIKEPGKVFDFVRQRLIENISQEGRQDGMDAILLCIHDNGKIEYAGANNSPVSFHEGVMQSYAADKMPVGLGEKNESFKTNTLKLQKGDMLYLYTDGFADQFGGPKGKKFKYKQLNEMLSSISTLDVKAQEKLMESKFKEWKGDLEQVDDVCVLGIRI